MDPVTLVLFRYLGHVKLGRSTRTLVWSVRQKSSVLLVEGRALW